MKTRRTLLLPIWLTLGVILGVLPVTTSAMNKVNNPNVVNPANTKDDDCPPVERYDAIYHLDTACDKRAQNKFQDSLDRGRQRQWIQEQGIYHVPDRLTIECPAAGAADGTTGGLQDMFQHFNSSDPTYNYGYSTMWIVHNNANFPVVLSWVDRSKKITTPDGNYYYQEVSAIDGSTTPPHHDTNAIIPPGQWRMVSTYDGHVFYARRLIVEKGKGPQLGPVVMQHRVGLIPIQNVFGHALENFCDPNDPDIEPVVEVGEDHHLERAPEFRRSLRPPLRACNTQDIGFRNLVGCPLNVYYSGMFNMTGKPRNTDEACSLTPKSCHEEFKFHLGKNPYSSDFHWGWDSQTKFEGTYVGHNFVFRLQANDDIVVDSVSIQPTYINDCPSVALEEAIEKDLFLKSVSVTKSSGNVKGNDDTIARVKRKLGDEQQQLRRKKAANGADYDDEEF